VTGEVAVTIPRAPLPWQSETWERLRPLIDAQTLPHALLAAGPEAIGKQHFMRSLAASLLCDQPSAGLACGSCRACELLQAGSHPDFLVVETEDNSRVIKIDQVRLLINFASKTPGIAARKIILLGPAEAMNNNAANALLKCLEEPSASTQILLYSHQPSALPATVRSRCQSLAMSPPAQAIAIEWLNQITGSAELSAQLLTVSNGRPLAARDVFLADGLEAQLALQKGLDALLDGSLSILEFPLLVADLELARVLALIQQRLEDKLRALVLQSGGAGLRDGFFLRDQLARLQRSVQNGANPNRQLTIEDCVTQLVKAVGGVAN
jgi:DNA polymerase-3 subunit delta'